MSQDPDPTGIRLSLRYTIDERPQLSRFHEFPSSAPIVKRLCRTPFIETIIIGKRVHTGRYWCRSLLSDAVLNDGVATTSSDLAASVLRHWDSGCARCATFSKFGGRSGCRCPDLRTSNGMSRPHSTTCKLVGSIRPLLGKPKRFSATFRTS